MEKENAETSHQQRFDNAMDRHYGALGRLIAAWAELEFSIDHLIWYLAETRQTVGACLTSHIMGGPAKIRTLIALVHLRGGNDELIKQLNKFEGRLRPLAERRNRYIHDWWVWSEDENDVAQVSISVDQKRLRFGIEDRSLGEIESVHSDIEVARNAFVSLTERIKSELSPTQRKWRQQETDIRFD